MQIGRFIKDALRSQYSCQLLLLKRELSATLMDSSGSCLNENESLMEPNCILNSKMASDSEQDTVVREGLAEIYQPSSVFYNPVQEFNRDLTIAVLSEFAVDHFNYVKLKEEKRKEKAKKDGTIDGILGEEEPNLNVSELEAGVHYENGMKILEGLAASGLRSVRFAKEIPGVANVLCNDFDKNAVEYIQRNISHNQVEKLVNANLGDASMVMYQHKKYSERFDVIDLDPYGSPSHFLDATVQSVRDGGLLCVTCTDMGVLCGNGSEACYAKYGSVSLKSKFCHEMALRIVLQSVESHANRYGRYIKPLISISADFYVRIFLLVFSGQNIVKQSVTKMSMVYHCGGCGAFSFQPMASKTPTSGSNFKYSTAIGPPVSGRCEHCNSRHHLGGPIWTEPMYDVEFIKRVLKRVEDDPSRFATSERINGMLNVMAEELQNIPLYYIVDHLFSIAHLTIPKLVQIRSAILHAGYEVSLSHAAKNSLKTNAPMSVLWDIIRCWAKESPVNEKHMKPGTIVHKILSCEPELKANFELHPDATPKSQGLLRWQTNPERNWGPKPRAKKGGVESLEERRIRGTEKAKEKRDNKRKAHGDTDYKQFDYKQFACKRFKKGKCELGEECQYSHENDNNQTKDTT